MEIVFKNKRWREVFYMLVALGKGDFTRRIPETNKGSSLEIIIRLINKVAEDLGKSLVEIAILRPLKSKELISEKCFILNEKFHIVAPTKNSLRMLGLKSSEIIGQPFKELLNKESQLEWEQLEKQLKITPGKTQNLVLKLPTPDGLEISSHWIIAELEGQKIKYMVTSITPVLNAELIGQKEETNNTEEKSTEKEPLSVLDRPADLDTVYQVRDYLNKHLNAPLLSLHDICLKFRTYPTKLRPDFKEITGLTPFQYHYKNRLELAKKLIEEGEVPLKNVPGQVGYSSYTPFSIAYKKEFRNSPSHDRENALLKRKQH